MYILCTLATTSSFIICGEYWNTRELLLQIDHLKGSQRLESV